MMVVLSLTIKTIQRLTTTPRRLPHLLIAFSCIHHHTNGCLNIALLTGSTRTSSPPTVLHPRVNLFIQNVLEERGHSVNRIDPGDFPLLEKPHFAYPPGKAPEKLNKVHSILQDADGYVCVTAEYNHSPSPALLNTLNHFGSSTFSFKPSAIGTFHDMSYMQCTKKYGSLIHIFSHSSLSAFCLFSNIQRRTMGRCASWSSSENNSFRIGLLTSLSNDTHSKSTRSNQP